MIKKWYSILILFIYISVCILIIKKERILLRVFLNNFVWLVIYTLFTTSNMMLTLNLNKKNFSPPIWIEDFGIDVSGRENVKLTAYTSSELASYTDYRVFANIKGEYYYVDCERFESKIDIIRKKVKKELIDLDDYRKIEKKDWGMDAIYMRSQSDYYIENKDTFIVLETNIEIGEEERKIIKKKLLS